MASPNASSPSTNSYFRRKASLWERLHFWKSNLCPHECRRRVVPNCRVLPNVPAKLHPHQSYASNKIRTTKYTLLSFVPKNLFEQFHRFANLYFLGIVLLNWVPQINAFGKEVSMIPVLFVLGVTAIKDAFEDRRRYGLDKRVNNATCRVYDSEQDRYVKTKWKHVKVGDIVHLSCNEMIPADMLLLRSSDEQGLCYIETANLDGESNLKQRQIAQTSSNNGVFNPSTFDCAVECDPPNNKIYRFYGCTVLQDGQRFPINNENLILRDCVLKNTDFVEGLVIYAGHETKAMLNNGGPRYKRSKLERFMNRDVMWCIVILVLLCIVGAIGNGLWLRFFDSTDIVPYLVLDANGKQYSTAVEGVISFWTFVIILQVMIPISLYVTIEIIKLGQVFHIHEDLELFDTRTNRRVECRALNIPEELGQVQYVFSDKTGTLTENNMVFCRCSIGGVDYAHARAVPSNVDHSVLDTSQYATKSKPTGDVAQNEPAFAINPRLQEELSNMELEIKIDSSTSMVYLNPEKQRIQDFFLLMAVCNTVVVSKYPHKDHMNSSGLCLNAGSSTGNLMLASGFGQSGQDKYVRLVNMVDTPPRSGASTPTSESSTPRHRPHQLYLPGMTGRPLTPTTPAELRPHYEGESPDEVALVDAAFMYNCKLLKRTPPAVVVALPGEGIVEFKVLHVLPFDAVRKRMSVVLQHPMTNERVLYCKGADSTILPLLAPPQTKEAQDMIAKTQNHLHGYSRKGLRILCMTRKIIGEEEYSTWLRQHRDAELSLTEREEALHVSACLLETNLELLGATGIEDKLQEGVPECIASLRSAGIVVWVLTGDKQETAVNIAFACKLFSSGMEVITLNTRSKETASETIAFYLQQMYRDERTEDRSPTPSHSSSSSSILSSILSLGSKWGKSSHRNSSRRRHKRALVIDTHTLGYVLDKSIAPAFLELAQQCSAVLCCRTTPLQKASVVRLVKEKLKVLTLAIGDGANDVSMIQTADVGVGISGQEGMQAVMASDFALARFHYMERLLLVHGHWCYDRLARTILYFFYKNASFIFIIMWYQLYCGFTAMVMIDQLYLMLYNVLFTSLPPIVLGIYDKDCPADVLLCRPSLYFSGRHSKTYTKYSFWVNMADALYQSIVIFFIPTMAYYDSDCGIWEFGTLMTVACIFVQLLHLSIETKSWTWLHLISILLSIGGFFAFAAVYNAYCLGAPTLQNPYMVFQHVICTAVFWFSLALVCVLACMPRFVIRSLQATLTPSHVALAVMEVRNGEKEADRSSPTVSSISWSRGSSGSSVVFRTTGNDAKTEGTGAATGQENSSYFTVRL